MRSPFVAYTLARLAIFLVVAAVLYAVGARDLFVLIVLAALFSGLLSLVLLRRQRQAISARITDAVNRPRPPRRSSRLDAGAAGEDE